MSSHSVAGLLAASGSLGGLSMISVALRFIVRMRQTTPLYAADWLSIAALIFYLAAVGCSFGLVHEENLGYAAGGGKPENQAKLTAELQIVYRELFQVCLTCIKLSAIFFYRAVFHTRAQGGIFNIVTLATIGIVISWLITFALLTGLQCGVHFSALWNGKYLEYCTLSFPYLYGWSVSELILDVWILVLPIIPILRLRTDPRTKLSILGVFSLAFVSLGACIARLVQYLSIELAGKTYFLHHDENATLRGTCFFDILEGGMSMIALNLPILWRSASVLATNAQHTLSGAIAKGSGHYNLQRAASAGSKGASGNKARNNSHYHSTTKGEDFGNSFEAHASLERADESGAHNWIPPSTAIKVHRVVEVRHEHSITRSNAASAGRSAIESFA